MNLAPEDLGQARHVCATWRTVIDEVILDNESVKKARKEKCESLSLELRAYIKLLPRYLSFSKLCNLRSTFSAPVAGAIPGQVSYKVTGANQVDQINASPRPCSYL